MTTWHLAIYLLTSTKTNLAALELARHLGVCYRTAWRLKHKIMQAMTTREEPRKLHGFVQIDDAYLGGERHGGKPGRGSENKQSFVIAVETDENLECPRFAVIEPLRAFDNDAMTDWHAIRQAKYAWRYLAEPAYRFNRRFRLREMTPRLTTAIMACNPWPERSLRSTNNFVD
jgi:hypothetical protein